MKDFSAATFYLKLEVPIAFSEVQVPLRFPSINSLACLELISHASPFSVPRPPGFPPPAFGGFPLIKALIFQHKIQGLSIVQFYLSQPFPPVPRPTVLFLRPKGTLEEKERRLRLLTPAWTFPLPSITPFLRDNCGLPG